METVVLLEGDCSVKRSEKSMLAFALILGLFGGCASYYQSSQASVYEPSKLTIQSVRKLENQSVRVEYQALTETLYHSPGVVINNSKREITLRVIRAPTEDMPFALTSTEDSQRPQRVGLTDIIEVKNPSDKPIYLLDNDGQRSLIYKGQGSGN